MSGVIVCYTRCWTCMFGDCHKPPKWHTWADTEDVEHARSVGLPDPSTQRCACTCAEKRGNDEANTSDR